MIRVRFAPSPTGPLHIGGVRTALYNYLFAKKHKGTFILRIEDTDRQRFVPGAEEYIIDSLNWCGILFDEGPHIGGAHQPYRQSERREIYRKFAEELVAAGNAYYAFDLPDELEQVRKQNQNFQYDKTSRMLMKNSLTLTEDETRQKLASGQPYVVRIKIPENTQIEIQDMIRGHVVFDSNLLDDKVLFKSDGLPTYHLANVVDDHLMEITHVIRGEEWLPSTPMHVLLYRFFNWNQPEFAHLPLILKPQGSGKLSKRDGDSMGFPVFPTNWKDPHSGEIYSGYREWGYLPEAFVNMLALLGWNPGTVQEIFSLQELIDVFSIEKVHKSGAKFNPEKTKWFNQQYIHKTEDNKFVGFLREYLTQQNISCEEVKLLKISQLIKDRIILLTEIGKQINYFFFSPESYDTALVQKHATQDSEIWMRELTTALTCIEEWNTSSIETQIKQMIHDKGYPAGKVFNLLRIALTGTNAGVGLADILSIIGLNDSNERILNFEIYLKKNNSFTV